MSVLSLPLLKCYHQDLYISSPRICSKCSCEHCYVRAASWSSLIRPRAKLTFWPISISKSARGQPYVLSPMLIKILYTFLSSGTYQNIPVPLHVLASPGSDLKISRAEENYVLHLYLKKSGNAWKHVCPPLLEVIINTVYIFLLWLYWKIIYTAVCPGSILILSQNTASTEKASSTSMSLQTMKARFDVLLPPLKIKQISAP